MKNVELLDKTIVESVEPVKPIEVIKTEPAMSSEPKLSEKPHKSTKRLARVVDYNASRGIIVYKLEGVTYQSNCVKYDGESEYIEI